MNQNYIIQLNQHFVHCDMSQTFQKMNENLIIIMSFKIS